MGFSRKEIKDSVLDTTRQTTSQIGSLVNEFINITLHEINDPAWAFNKQFIHKWNFLRRKTTLTVTASDYLLPRDLDKVAFMRQTDSPTQLTQIRDEEFFKLVPNPTATGNPRYYRLWETEGVSTRLTANDTINIVSSSNNDAGDTELAVSISGYDTDGIWRTETYELNGTTSVTGSVTFVANRAIIVQKQKNTTGKITVTENSEGTTLVVLGPTERAPKFKIASFYPLISGSETIYLEYFTFIPEMHNDSDVPLMPDKYHYVVRIGALSKVYQYLNKEQEFIATDTMFRRAVRSMVAGDQAEPDLVEHLMPQDHYFPFIHNRRSEDAISY